MLCALTDGQAPRSPAGFGSGCHPDRGIAALRAITEAAQTRAIAISGARDDLGPDLYAPGVAVRFRRAIEGSGEAATRPWAALPTAARDCLRADLRAVVAAVTAAGCGPVLAVDLSREPRLAVVRLVVPGLEPAAPTGRGARRGARRAAGGAPRMTAIVFVGPSLAGASPAPPPGVTLAGPAAAGDLYRAARAGARTIGLADGVFEDRPTVWHKEILWALERGVRVIGAASLGALRAAECAPFGMEGVGRVFELVRDGTIEDDSDLAVVHAPAELGWQPLTEARVNVRASLDAAEAAGVLSRRDARALAARAAAMPFRTLSWRALLDTLDGGRRARLAAWLPDGRVDLKRADALALIDAVAAGDGTAPPSRTAFRLADTRYWRSAVDWFERRPASGADEAVLDELRLDPARFERALVRAFARRAAAPEPLDPAPDEGELLDELRLRHGLATAAGFRGWLARSRGEPAALAAALAAEERLAQALERRAGGLAPDLLDALRVDGRFEALAARAADKRARLDGRPPPPYREAELVALIDALCARLRVSIDCDDLDLAARALGLEDRRALHRLLADERDYARALAEDGG